MSFVFVKIKKTKQGFSLIELLVSLSIFAIIMVASTGTLLTLIDVNAKAQALYTATTNLSFALDSMTREMRMGRDYNAFDPTSFPANLPSGTNDSVESGIAFNRERDGVRIGYRLVVDNDSGIGVLEQKNGGGSWMPLTSSNEVDIESFTVRVENSDPFSSGSDEEQPVAYIIIGGKVSNGLDMSTTFNIQTRITQRTLDTQ